MGQVGLGGCYRRRLRRAWRAVHWHSLWFPAPHPGCRGSGHSSQDFRRVSVRIRTVHFRVAPTALVGHLLWPLVVVATRSHSNLILYAAGCRDCTRQKCNIFGSVQSSAWFNMTSDLLSPASGSRKIKSNDDYGCSRSKGSVWFGLTSRLFVSWLSEALQGNGPASLGGPRGGRAAPLIVESQPGALPPLRFLVIHTCNASQGVGICVIAGVGVVVASLLCFYARWIPCAAACCFVRGWNNNNTRHAVRHAINKRN